MNIIEKIEVSLTKEAQELAIYLCGSMFEDNPDIRKACAHNVFEFVATHDLSAETKRIMIDIATIGIAVESQEERKKEAAEILSPILYRGFDALITKDPSGENFSKIEKFMKNFFANVRVNLDDDILDSLKYDEGDISKE